MSEVVTAIRSFVAQAQSIRDDYYKKRLGNLVSPEIEMKMGKKYVKLICDNSAYGFIDAKTGDIFMAASWSAPAKHARGNVLSEHNGLEAISKEGMSIRYRGCFSYADINS